MTTSASLIATKEAILQGLDKALTEYRVASLIQKGERIVYDYITKSHEIEFEYSPTVIPPKKFFFPKAETLCQFTSDGKVEAKIEAKPLVLFGVRPCDLNGIKIMNEAFADDNGDPNYMAKQEKAIVIGLDCKKVCDKHAFCYKLGTNDAKGGYDAMLYDLGNSFAIEIATEKGKTFINKYFVSKPCKQDEIKKFQQEKAAGFANMQQLKDLDKLPEMFEANKHHPIWNQEGSRCLSCGSCIMVCPTCYCFDVRDEWQLNLKTGERTRHWDACMLSSFATVAGGENFRHSATARLHHRINRKFNYLMKKHNLPVCVGCGRCVRACLVEISPKTIAKAIVNDQSQD